MEVCNAIKHNRSPCSYTSFVCVLYRLTLVISGNCKQLKWIAYYENTPTINFVFWFAALPGFILVPPYEGVETVYLSTKAPPGSPNNTVYHVILCLASSNPIDPLGLPPATVFLDPMGNVIPFYPDPVDKIGKPTNDYYYPNLYLDAG